MINTTDKIEPQDFDTELRANHASATAEFRGDFSTTATKYLYNDNDASAVITCPGGGCSESYDMKIYKNRCPACSEPTPARVIIGDDTLTDGELTSLVTAHTYTDSNTERKWDDVADTAKEKIDAALDRIDRYRNQKAAIDLSSSEITQTTEKEAVYLELLEYLEELRDIEITYASDPDSVVWPTVPAEWTSCTYDHTTDTFTYNSHPYVNDDKVKIRATILPGGYSKRKKYNVINKATNTFQLSETQGGSAVDGSSNGSGIEIR